MDRRHADEEHRDDAQPAQQRRERGRCRTGECVSAPDAGERVAEPAHTRQPVGSTTGDRELDATVERLDQLTGQRRAGRCLAPSGGRRQRAGQQRDQNRGDQQADGDHQRGERQHQPGGCGCGEDHRKGDHGRRQCPQVEVLKRIDIGDEPSQQLAAAAATECRSAEWCDHAVETGSQPREHAQRQVVGDQPLAVAQDRARDPEGSHRNDHGRQLQDVGSLGSAADQVPGGRQQSGRRRDGAEREQNREGEPAPLAVLQLGDTPQTPPDARPFTVRADPREWSRSA